MSLVVTHERGSRSLQTINRLDRERAIGITGNVAPGHSQAEAMAKVDELAKELPLGYRVVAERPGVAARRDDERALLRARASASSSRTWCSRASSTRSCTR